MKQKLAMGVFYLVALVLVLWTGSLTVTFVSSVLPDMNWLVPFFALVVFDGGMLAWLLVYTSYAEGSGQRAVSISLTAVDLIGVALMVTAEIFLGGQTLVAAPEMLGEWALWGIGGWTVFNVVGVVAFHLMDPKTRQEMALREEMDAVFDEALAKLKNKRAQQSGRLSDVIADGMMTELRARLAQDRNGDGVPDVFQRETGQGGEEVPILPPNAPPGAQMTKARVNGREEWMMVFPPREAAAVFPNGRANTETT
ncbi:MAG: hypothetical protein ACE5EY_14005 [Anaerolineae bacterium]